MAFNAATQWEFQAAGDNGYGGGFFDADPGTSVDLAVSNSPVSFTDLAIDGADATKITSSANPFSAADAGNVINVTAGTGFTVQRVQIVSVASNVATCDKSVGSTGSTGGTGVMGGALALPTDALLELAIPGNMWWLKGSSTFTLTGDISVAANGSAGSPVVLAGYSSTRGDVPTGASRPTIAAGAYAFSLGNYWNAENLIVTTTAANGFQCGKIGRVVNCKCTNSSGTADRYALYLVSYGAAIRCEGVSTNGTAFLPISHSKILYSHAHDSKNGVTIFNTIATVAFSVISSCSSNAIYSNSGGSPFVILGNTLYGGETPTGKGVYVASTTLTEVIVGNIFYGFSTGIDSTDSSDIAVLDYNNYYNCTTDVSGVSKGANDFSLDPEFAAAGSGDFTPSANMQIDIDWSTMGL